MTEAERKEIEQFVNQYGPANCWTGSLGTACLYLRQLLQLMFPPDPEPATETQAELLE